MLLPREEYVEQAYFFQMLSQRIQDNHPLQDLFESLREEVLSTTKLPLAISFMLGELKHRGVFGPAMAKLSHYFAPFQTFVVQQAEKESGRFDLRVALEVLYREAEYRAREPTRQGMFLYQFECLCRNRLPYDGGLAAMAGDPIYDTPWKDWLSTVRRQIGLVDMADLIYVRSEYYQARAKAEGHTLLPEDAVLFGMKEGRIAAASRRKDPLLLFSALQRQLGYPSVPRLKPANVAEQLLPQLARRMERLEARVKLLEEEQRGGIDITKFYAPGQGQGPSGS